MIATPALPEWRMIEAKDVQPGDGLRGDMVVANVIPKEPALALGETLDAKRLLVKGRDLIILVASCEANGTNDPLYKIGVSRFQWMTVYRPLPRWGDCA